MFIFALLVLLFVVYPSIGLIVARSQYGLAMANWRALDPEKEKARLSQEAREELAAFDKRRHADHCYMALNPNGSHRYSFLYEKGCTCHNSGARKRIVARLNTNELPAPPAPSLAPLITWPAVALVGAVKGGDKGAALEREQELMRASEKELARIDKKIKELQNT